MSNALELRTQQRQQLVNQIRGDDFKRQIASALPGNVTPDRFVRATVTALMQTPDLVEVEPDSLFQAVIRCAQDGLLPDGREAAIVKRKDKASYMPMIGGFRKIAAEHGWTLRTKVVYANDEFDYTEEPPTLSHRPVRPGTERGQLVAAYAVAVHRDGRQLQTVLHPEDVAKRRSMATTDAVWKQWPAEMWEKSAGRDLFGQLPLGDRELVERILAAATDPADAAVALYGPGADRALTRSVPDASAIPTTSPATGGVPGAEDRQAGGAAALGEQTTASTPPSVAAPPVPGPDMEGEPSLDDEPVATAPSDGDGTAQDAVVALAQQAAIIEIPNGRHKGLTLGQLLEKGDNGVDWLRWALRNWNTDPFKSELWNFARVYAPEVYAQVAAEKEANAA